jgi:23S rRNA (uracil1939-C5)-methyltransferase
MSLSAGQEITIAIEKPASGGRMIGRHENQVVLVRGAIPGERVVARVERVEKRLAFAEAMRIEEPSGDRREPAGDPLCGGCLFAHVAYPRQVVLKSQIISDAFVRIGRIPLEGAIAVAPSPEQGYRMRARLHAQAPRADDGGTSTKQAVGFYREGTHQLCDARPTQQLLPAALDAIDGALGALAAQDARISAVEVTENVAGDQRALHFELTHGGTFTESALAKVLAAAAVKGGTLRASDGAMVSAGDPHVTDPLRLLTDGRGQDGELRRSPASFFQGNRYLLSRLVTSVLDVVLPEGDVLDLYAGVGLFSLALAATGRTGITAVEGDRSSGEDLRINASAFAGAVSPVIGSVENAVLRRGSKSGRPAARTIIVDPPRTGISREALDGIAGYGAERIVYVSCDPPTLARDARRLLDAGYGLRSVHGFDLFPNTPHVEALAVFDRS